MFTHLHVHTEYSLLDGACRIRELVSRVKAMGQTACAITDHGVMYGCVAFYKECKKQGIKPIIGCEVYVAPRSRFNKDHALDAVRYHLILLAKNEIGYKNLCYLVSMGFQEGFYMRPRIDMELLREHHEGLICLSACIQGQVPRLILEERYDEAKEKALEFLEIFGQGNYYLELQDHGLPEEKKAAAALIRLGRETGIPLAVTNDAHYLTRDDAYAQDVLMCIQTGKTLDEPERMKFTGSELYMKTETEMRALFPDQQEAFDNTNRIAAACTLDFQFGKYHLPAFLLPEGETDAAAYLRKLCEKGLREKYGEGREDVRRQLDYELDMIGRMGFTDYFLIVQDFVAYAKGAGIPVGPGRGSAAGSIVSYCLNITTVDPIRYHLYFERFLNPERVSMPDIDMDFCERRRGEVVDYVKNKYGTDHVAQIVTFNTLKAKNAVRSVCKVLGLSFQEENRVAKAIPNGLKMTLKDAISLSKELRDMMEADERVRRVIETAQAIEDMPKDSGTHAAGVVITKDPVYTYVPLTLSKKDNTIATQYVMTTLEELGLLKMDFLGLRNLTIIDDAVKDIRRKEPELDIQTIPTDDGAVYDMLAAGKTAGVFQLESAGMTGVCVSLGARSIEDITAVIALYRPGPMDSIPRFIESSQHPEKITYLHPLLEPILNVTYGCIVYQEQVIEIFRRLAGFSLGQADMIRRAMSKKHQDEIERERTAFLYGDPERGIDGAEKRGIDPEIAGRIYDDILAFANYAFNKAHAVSYAIVAYQTAWLKCHYPREYMAALMSSVLDLPDKVAEYTEACREMGIQLLPPDVNESRTRFTVSGENIRYGLAAVKGIGAKFIDGMIAEREENGKFTSFVDFCERTFDLDVGRRAVEGLIKAGAFDTLGHTRRALIFVAPRVLEGIAATRRGNVEGQLDLFGGASGTPDPLRGLEIPEVEEFTPAERMALEREVTGLYLSGHPMDEYRQEAHAAGAVNIAALLTAAGEGESPYHDGDEVALAGAVTTSRGRATRNGSLMVYLTVDDGTGSMELICFQRVLEKAHSLVEEGNMIFARGRLSVREDREPQLVVNDILPLNKLRRTEKKPEKRESTLWVRLADGRSPLLARLRKLFAMFPGREPFVLYLAEEKKRLGGTCLRHEALVQELRDLCGEENVVIQ